MKGVQCYELFGGIALKNHAFSFSYTDLPYIGVAHTMLHTYYDLCTFVRCVIHFFVSMVNNF